MPGDAAEADVHSSEQTSMSSPTISPQLTKVLKESEKLTENERLLLARLLLDSLLADTGLEEKAWMHLGLRAFQRDWDNEEDAVYDEWRKHYGVSEG